MFQSFLDEFGANRPHVKIVPYKNPHSLTFFWVDF